jgi:hypothetical protein
LINLFSCRLRLIRIKRLLLDEATIGVDGQFLGSILTGWKQPRLPDRLSDRGVFELVFRHVVDQDL